MSRLTQAMQQAADVLADRTIQAFWDQYERRLSDAVRQVGIRTNPEVKLRSLILQVLQASMTHGWVDVHTYAYQAFIHTDPLSLPDVLDYLAEQVAENGILTTHDLTFANEMVRQLRALKHCPPSQPWWKRLIG